MALSSRYSLGAASIIMALSVLLSRFMGLIRDKVISWQFGSGSEADIYFAAFVVPDLINYLLAGGYVSMTLIPLLSSRFTENQEDGWDFFSTVISWALVASLSLTVVAFICAPLLARLTAPGFDPQALARLTLYIRIILPGQIFFLTGSCITALLYVRKAFTIPALTPLLYNGCIILGGLAWPWVVKWFNLPEHLAFSMTGYALGVSVGALVGALLLPWWAAKGEGELKLKLRFRHPLLKRYIFLALPLMLGQSIIVLDEQFVRVFGSLAPAGTVSLLSYARRIMLVPVGVVAQAAGVASFPFLASLAAKGDEAGFNRTLNQALQGSLYIIIPLCAWMIIAAAPIFGLIFEGGRFGAAQTMQAAPWLQILLLGVPIMTVQQIIGRAFYAKQDTLSPVIIGTLITIIAVPIYPYAVKSFHGAGIAGLSVIGLLCYTSILCLWWIKRFDGQAFSGLIKTVFILCFISALTAFTTHMLGKYAIIFLLLKSDSLLTQILNHIILLSTSLSFFVLFYLSLSYFFFPQALFFKKTKQVK